MQGLLDGIRVIDFTQVVSGPVCTRILAELGAEVIKIEFAPGGDQSRLLPVIHNGRSAYFCQHNQGKKSVCLDLRHAEAKAILARLIAGADVVAENFSPGAIGRLGFGWDAVRALNPRAVMCSISAFGQTGPLAQLPGFDYVAQAVAGVTSMTGDPDGPPALVGLAMGDVGTGVAAVAAITAALYRRERSGEGRYIDISLLDVYFHSHELNVQVASFAGQHPHRSGSHHGLVAPIGIYATATGYLFLVVLQPMWARLCQAMERPDLAADPRFADNAGRIAHGEELRAAIQAWLDGLGSREEALRRLEKARVPAAPIFSVEEAMAHPHLIERGTVRTIDDPQAGRFQIPAQPLRFPGTAMPEPAPAPYLGQHNREVLAAYAGLADGEIDRLAAAGVLAAEPVPAA